MEEKVGEYNNNINIRLYCFEKELKGKIKNYDEIIVDERIQTGVIINKKLIDDYKKYFDYDKFIKTFEKTNVYKKIVNDKNILFQ